MAQASPPGAAPGSAAAQFEQALALHQQGELPAAAALYQAILDRDPAHFDALHLLGVIAAQSGDPARAVELIARALQTDAGQPAAHYHRGLALRDLGRHTEALAGFEAVLALAPDHAEAWASHAETLQDLQRPDAAVQSYERLLTLQADHAQARFARGVLLQGMARNEEALADYDRVLEQQPDFAGALNNRALLLQALGRPAEALAGYDRLLALAPDHAPAHHGRGLALQELQQFPEALDAYARTLTLQPDLADARLQRGRVLRRLGRPEEALAELSVLLAGAPAHAEAWFEQGSLQQQLGRNDDALESYDRALSARPTFAEACNNRALLLLGFKRPEDALAACERAVAIKADFAEAWANRGLALTELDRPGAALESYARALQLRPDYAEALANRGHLLMQERRLEEALDSYTRAVAIEPGNPEFLCSRGAVLDLLKRPMEALACYDQTLALQPDHATALSNRGGVLRVLGRHGEAAAAYARLQAAAPDYPHALGNRLHAQLYACDWTGYAEACAQLQTGIAAGRPVDLPFSFLSVSASASLQQQCARLQAAEFPAGTPLWRGERYGHQRIRIAYVSGDLGFHAVSYLMAGLFEAHDRRRFEVYAFSMRPPGAAPFDLRIRAAFEHTIDASAFGDLEVARLLREHEIDIVVDLMGYTTLTRIGVYAQRAAPVQAAYLGYAGTLGTSYVDYLIADAVAIPQAASAYYDEQVVRLPPSFMPRDASVQVPATPSRAEVGLPERGFVFCCFNNAYKLNPPVFDVWMRLLAAVPESVLWLSDPGTEARSHLLDEARARGMESRRLVFAARTARTEDHLARLPLADLFLDTLPYNAHTTASDALWMGVPLLTCAGAAFASRVAASLLSAAGLSELITSNLPEYEALAQQLARDPARLAGLRARLAARRAEGALFDGARLCRHLEDAYLRMHERAQQGAAPLAFTLPG